MYIFKVNLGNIHNCIFKYKQLNQINILNAIYARSVEISGSFYFNLPMKGFVKCFNGRNLWKEAAY